MPHGLRLSILASPTDGFASCPLPRHRRGWLETRQVHSPARPRRPHLYNKRKGGPATTETKRRPARSPRQKRDKFSFCRGCKSCYSNGRQLETPTTAVLR